MVKRLIESIVRKFFSNLIQIDSSVTQLLIKNSQESSRDYILGLFQKSEVGGGDIPLLFSSRKEIQTHVVNLLLNQPKSLRKMHVLEFGVFKGTSLRFFAKQLNEYTCIGFDSFEGLQSNFGGLNADLLFRLEGRVPKFMPKNTTIVKGMIEEKTEEFIQKNELNIKLIHLDLDVYVSTKYVLRTLKNKLHSGTYLLFDEMFGNPFWEKGEFKALQETFTENQYKWLAFGPNQALIQLK